MKEANAIGFPTEEETDVKKTLWSTDSCLA